MSDEPQAPEEAPEELEKVEQIDAPSEPTVHRDVDEDGNPDDLLTEDEALEQAEADGLAFTDVFTISIALPEDEGEIKDHNFETREEAEALCEKYHIDPLIIVQTRHPKLPEA